jgi:ABC-type glycerol-3-phosphate transport system substrate-binding protein
MPIGVGNYDMYVKLMTTAPELKGRWKMIPFVGHINSDGVVDRSTGGNISCTVIMKSTKHLDETWNFMKWYLGEDLQTEYANEVEATFGAGSRWSPANVETIKNMAYTDQEIQAILDQWEWYKEAPNVLGGYYTSRYLLTALNKTVLQNKNARTSLEDAVQAINKELERKQEEFHVTSVTTAE